MRLAHGSCLVQAPQNNRLQYLIHHAQDEGGQDPQRHPSQQEGQKIKKNTKTEVYTTHGLVRPLGQEETSGNMNRCSCRNNLAGLSESQNVFLFVWLFVGAW